MNQKAYSRCTVSSVAVLFLFGQCQSVTCFAFPLKLYILASEHFLPVVNGINDILFGKQEAIRIAN